MRGQAFPAQKQRATSAGGKLGSGMGLEAPSAGPARGDLGTVSFTLGGIAAAAGRLDSLISAAFVTGEDLQASGSRVAAVFLFATSTDSGCSRITFEFVAVSSEESSAGRCSFGGYRVLSRIVGTRVATGGIDQKIGLTIAYQLQVFNTTSGPVGTFAGGTMPGGGLGISRALRCSREAGHEIGIVLAFYSSYDDFETYTGITNTVCKFKGGLWFAIQEFTLTDSNGEDVPPGFSGFHDCHELPGEDLGEDCGPFGDAAEAVLGAVLLSIWGREVPGALLDYVDRDVEGHLPPEPSTWVPTAFAVLLAQLDAACLCDSVSDGDPDGGDDPDDDTPPETEGDGS